MLARLPDTLGFCAMKGLGDDPSKVNLKRFKVCLLCAVCAIVFECLSIQRWIAFSLPCASLSGTITAPACNSID